MRRTLIVGIFLILSLSLPVLTSADDPAARCSQITDSDEGVKREKQGYCYVDVAAETQDLSYCGGVDFWADDGFRVTGFECWIRAQARMENISYCRNLETTREKERCYHIFGIHLNSTELCSLAGDFERHCLSRVGAKTGEVELCQKSGPFKPECYHALAVTLEDPSYCEESYDIDQCYFDFGHETKNPEFCQLTPDKEEECLCDEGEELVNHECRELKCRYNQYVSDHQCVSLNCRDYYNAWNHTCIPKFTCSDSDGEDFETAGTCRAPNAIQKDLCNNEDDLVEWRCDVSPTDCGLEVIQCSSYCNSSNYLLGECTKGKCVCYNEEIRHCDYVPGISRRVRCYQEHGIKGVRPYFKIPSLNLPLFLVLLALASFVLWPLKGQKKIIIPSFKNLKYWVVRAAVATALLTGVVIITLARWHVCIAFATVFFGYVWNRLQRQVAWEVSNLWSWWFRILLRIRGAVLGGGIGYFFLPSVVTFLVLLYFVEEVILALLAGDSAAISYSTENLSKIIKTAWPMSRYLFSRFYGLFFGVLQAGIGGVIGYRLGKLGEKNSRRCKRIIIFGIIAFLILTLLLTQSWRAMS